ncbi:MAG: ABC transporter permease, partial [Candidatus Kariarchaeaceae archaeon]
AYFHIVRGTLFTESGRQNTILHFIPLVLIGMAISIPARAKIDNIGAEGQFVMGILGAYWVVFTFPDLNSFILIPLMFLGGIVAGALYALPIALFRVFGKFKGADIVSGFLLVFPAISYLQYMINGRWRSADTRGFPQSDQISENARLPLFEDLKIPILAKVHITLFIAIFLIILLNQIFFKSENGIPKTKIAYEVKVVGKNEKAARVAGINYMKVAFITTMVSGALAGVAGVGLLAGQDLRLRESVSRGYGFAGIVVAWLGGLSPGGVIISAFIVAMLYAADPTLQVNLKLPSTVRNILIGGLLISILVSQFFLRYTFEKVHSSNIETKSEEDSP